MNRAVPRVQQLATGGGCDELGCKETGLWLVEYESTSFNWCRKHLVLRMADADFWLRTQRTLGRDGDRLGVPFRPILYRRRT